MSRPVDDGWKVTQMHDRGSVVLMGGLAGLALTAIVLVGSTSFLGRIGDRDRARLAADAAALAGVTGGRSAAAELAVANGGQLVVWRSLVADDRRGVVVHVVVDVDGVRAESRATDAP